MRSLSSPPTRKSHPAVPVTVLIRATAEEHVIAAAAGEVVIPFAAMHKSSDGQAAQVDLVVAGAAPNADFGDAGQRCKWMPLRIKLPPLTVTGRRSDVPPMCSTPPLVAATPEYWLMAMVTVAVAVPPWASLMV